MENVWKAGADIAVIGTSIEKNLNTMFYYLIKFINKMLKKFKPRYLVYILANIICTSINAQHITRRDYIKKYAPLAVKQMQAYRIPASITLAQGILESNNGNSRLAS